MAAVCSCVICLLLGSTSPAASLSSFLTWLYSRVSLFVLICAFLEVVEVAPYLLNPNWKLKFSACCQTVWLVFQLCVLGNINRCHWDGTDTAIWHFYIMEKCILLQMIWYGTAQVPRILKSLGRTFFNYYTPWTWNNLHEDLNLNLLISSAEFKVDNMAKENIKY